MDLLREKVQINTPDAVIGYGVVVFWVFYLSYSVAEALYHWLST